MPDPIPSAIVDGLFDYQFHQVAMYCPDGVDDAVKFWTDGGFTNWIRDEAELKGLLYNGFDCENPEHDHQVESVVTSATMAFNYDIMPMELEFLHYRGPSRWQGADGRGASPFISHMSTYVDDVIWETRRCIEAFGIKPFHRFITQNHTNPGVVGKKRFIESIFHTRINLGYDLKLIQKVDWDYPDEAWLDQEF